MSGAFEIRIIPVSRIRIDRTSGRPVETNSDSLLRIGDQDEMTYAFVGPSVPGSVLARVLAARRNDYRFRTPLGFSPLGLFDLRPIQRPDGRWLSADGTVLVRRPAVSKKGAYPIAERTLAIEETSLYPVVLGRHLTPFQAPWKDLRMTPLPWDGTSARLMDARALAARPHHEAYLFENREDISRETQRDDQRLVSAQWFHPTRFGPYQIYPWKVLVRTNTRWAAAVVSDAVLPWAPEIGDSARRMIIPGLKASFIAERRRGPRGVGAPIGEDEAHYLAAVLNATPHRILMEATNSSRSYSLTNPPLHLPAYDPGNSLHRDLAAVGRAAAAGQATTAQVDPLFLRLLPS